MTGTDPCDACGATVDDALARTVRLTVDRSQIDAQRLCPTCFATWVDRYDEEMRQSDVPGDAERDPDDEDIIVD